jgi:V/A-type H+-transporting ATPase subunit E
MISQQSADSKTIAKLLEAIIASIEKEGINTDLSAVIPKHVSVDEINKLLEEKILKKLKDGTVLLGGFKGGVQVKLHDKMITIDITDSAMTELVAKYVRKDFRRFLFKS